MNETIKFSCKFFSLYFPIFLVVRQDYSLKAEDEYVIRGNDVLVKCKIPSFVQDQLTIVNWVDNLGNVLSKDNINPFGIETLLLRLIIAIRHLDCLRFF